MFTVLIALSYGRSSYVWMGMLPDITADFNSGSTKIGASILAIKVIVSFRTLAVVTVRYRRNMKEL
ncbi:hypothetical protein BGX38DRAFT_1177076, partial [Terfezia claveryi]